MDYLHSETALQAVLAAPSPASLEAECPDPAERIKLAEQLTKSALDHVRGYHAVRRRALAVLWLDRDGQGLSERTKAAEYLALPEVTSAGNRALMAQALELLVRDATCTCDLSGVKRALKATDLRVQATVAYTSHTACAGSGITLVPEDKRIIREALRRVGGTESRWLDSVLQPEMS